MINSKITSQDGLKISYTLDVSDRDRIAKGQDDIAITLENKEKIINFENEIKKGNHGYMKSENILILPGDGVGPGIMKEAIKIIDTLNTSKICKIEYESADIGGIAIDNHNTPLPNDTLQKAKASSSILGAVGTKKHESNSNEMKP